MNVHTSKINLKYRCINKMEEEYMSYDYFDAIIESLYYKKYITDSMIIVKQMFEKFPKELDCITSIVLNSLLEEIDISKKNSVIFLISYLKYLKST